MGNKGMITREYIAKLKLKRKKKNRALVLSFLAIIVVLGAVITAVVMKYSGDRVEVLKGQIVDVGVKPDLGDREGEPQLVLPGGPGGYSYYQEYANRDDASFDYDIPETELPDISTVQGNNWANEEIFGKNPSEPIALQYFEDACFVGDSRTEGLLLYSNLANIHGFAYKGLNIGKLKDEECINVPGVGNNLTCYQAISSTSYDYYYCMFGINELGWEHPDVFIDCFNQLIDHIYATNPNAIVYVESVITITKEKSEGDEVFTKEKVQQFNDLLLEMCKERGDVIFLDINAAVADAEGYLPEEGSFDGIHLYTNYCRRVIQYIRSNTYYRK